MNACRSLCVSAGIDTPSMYRSKAHVSWYWRRYGDVPSTIAIVNAPTGMRKSRELMGGMWRAITICDEG